MSEMEESDVEVVALKSRKSGGSGSGGGYIYYGPKGHGAGSTLKALCCVFVIAVLFLAIGATTGYLIGFESAGSAIWRPLDPEPIPPLDAPDVEPFRPDTDPFAAFKRDGVRYGGDYGVNARRSRPRSRSLLSGDQAEWCGNRHCCHPMNGVADEVGLQCLDLGRDECCDLMAQDICDWNCDDDVANVREDHVVRPGRKRTKRCAGHSDMLGVGGDDEDINIVDDEGPPKDALDLKEQESFMAVDWCGDVTEDVLDDETAEDEIVHYGEHEQQSTMDSDSATRRLKVIGHDSRKWMEDTSYPQSEVGKLENWAYHNYMGWNQCSGVKVSKRHILTAGHCCHEGKGGDWKSGWEWMGGVATAWQLWWAPRYRVSSMVTFSNWINRDDLGSAWDICVMQLADSHNGFMGFGWHSGITSNWAFNLWGYPGDKDNNIKWGHDDCKADVAVETDTMQYTCDTAGGMSGSGLWLKRDPVVDSTVYCVHAAGGDSGNVCARITQSKFNALKDYIAANGGW